MVSTAADRVSAVSHKTRPSPTEPSVMLQATHSSPHPTCREREAADRPSLLDSDALKPNNTPGLTLCVC